MKRFTIAYTETYTGTFTVELPDDAGEEDAIRELLDNADRYHVGDTVELTDSGAEVIDTREA